ncbi:Endonuclease [Luteimonas sp. 9C]|uniref:Z1 domain-containing protein n=1 Tax=Luteimonas sp. 9C TaxID=2653148 RepID=UPI0012EF7293|nr:Z1 domain-containing protein [Luteimonas sp. 9C]VXB25501.1 Endonuclease [Luteimonas sp. 9C]
MLTANEITVVKFVQELLVAEGEPITPPLISQKIDFVLQMMPKWKDGLDRDAVTEELIRRFSLWVGEDVTMASNVGHVAWLDSARKRDWLYWQRYREMLERKLSWTAVDAVDVSTDKVLGLLEDPLRHGPWDRRGLVVGHVQSGKTAHYTGLISKAADAQYKVIIVLAGLHNNLRSQTQIRLEEGFLGYDTSARDSLRPVGVGERDFDKSIAPNCATTRANSGDFGKKVAKHLAISPEQRPWLFVVKKNKSVLSELLRWIQNHVADTKTHDEDVDVSGDKLPRVRKIVTKLPLLVIDDEADHASVDTQEQTFDPDTGKPDEEHNPTAINKLIRRILNSFSRSAYVGYTATPFANIFIHERGETKQEGPDLFPAAFIHNLAAPSDYIGPSVLFGRPSPAGREGALPLIHTVNDYATESEDSGWMPQKHRNGHVPRWSAEEGLPPSLRKAIESFLLACAARVCRDQGREHSSMLIHVTRFTSVQNEVYAQVDEYIKRLKQRIVRRIDHQPILERLRRQWEIEFVPATDALVDRDMVPANLKIAWERLVAVLPEVIEDIEVRTINGTAKDVLDYAENDGKGLKVIAIGGDKLARGLTLEGLCTSYFLRASKMYDTLMQMGRWFGYRPGYVDLCRLYTTDDLVEWFGHITDAAAELREEFDLMASSGGTPREYGLKVQSHSVLTVTSQLKMRTARSLMVSFSGQLMQSVSLFQEKEILEKNLETTERFLKSLGVPSETNPERLRNGDKQRWAGYLWKSVPGVEVADFIDSLRTHPQAYRVQSAVLAEFIRSMIAGNELTEWTVAVLGNQSGTTLAVAPGVDVNMVNRKGEGIPGRYAIGVLLDPKDESIDLDADQWQAALDVTKLARKPDTQDAESVKEPTHPSGPAIRKVKGLGTEGGGVSAHPERGLLILYVLDPEGANESKVGVPVVAFGISFPGSKSDRKVEYKVNNVLWEQEYAPAG